MVSRAKLLDDTFSGFCGTALLSELLLVINELCLIQGQLARDIGDLC